MTEQELFLEAIKRSSPSERESFLERSCPDVAQRQRILALIARHHRHDRRLDEPMVDLLANIAETLLTPDVDEEQAATLAALRGLLAPSERPGAIGALGPYDITAVLGRGAFGIVVKAFDNLLQRIVAIKVLDPSLATTSPPRKRFLREARAAARIAHENVVRVYSVEEQPIPFMVMELVSGQTLQDVLNTHGPLEPKEVARLGREIALGLGAAHADGLVHRDVKPANVLLRDGLVKRAVLTDFGLARTADDASLTRSGLIAGSPLYMSPEQARGEPLDARSDLFALGSLLYTLCAGRPAFRASHPYAVLRRVVEDKPRSLRDVAPDCPLGLIAVVERLLAKRPEDRYPSAEAAAAALEQCLNRPPRSPRIRQVLTTIGAAMVLIGISIVGWRALVPPATDPIEANVPNVQVAPTPIVPLVVTSIDEGNQPGTLRWAVEEANQREGEQTITFDPEAFKTLRTITLKQGPLTLPGPGPITIIGPRAGLILSGAEEHQVLIIGKDPRSPGQVTLVDLTITAGTNTSQQPCGGGVLVQRGAKLHMTGCTLRDNVVHEEGGAGVYVHTATAELVNCTLVRNMAAEGAAVKNYRSQVTLINCTITENTVRQASIVYTLGSPSARTEVYNTILDGNNGLGFYAFDDAETAGDYNLTDDDTAPGIHSLRQSSANLGQLTRQDSPTEIIPIAASSLAHDAGDNAFIPKGISTDQRGQPRISNGRVDLGAFEVR